MAKPWFRPKTYGWGANPASWEGWAVTLGFCALLIADVRLVPWLPADRTFGLVLAVAVGVALLAGFIALILAKGGGPWKWRWGDGD